MFAFNILFAALTAIQLPDGWRIQREDGTLLAEQHAAKDTRPYIHPLMSPSGKGTLTENAPKHHPWQHGLYTGLHAVNGINFWEREKNQFHPQPVAKPVVNGDTAKWTVCNRWTSASGEEQLDETQIWTLTDKGKYYVLDMEWHLKALRDVKFGKYPYGGLFLRMPWRGANAAVSDAVNNLGQHKKDAEQQRAKWVAVTMPPAEGGPVSTIAIIEHPSNPGYPNPWRVDGQLGVAPSHCILGPWKLDKDSVRTNKYRVVITDGKSDAALIESESVRYK